jgi:hypothetical protein
MKLQIRGHIPLFFGSSCSFWTRSSYFRGNDPILDDADYHQIGFQCHSIDTGRSGTLTQAANNQEIKLLLAITLGHHLLQNLSPIIQIRKSPFL